MVVDDCGRGVKGEGEGRLDDNVFDVCCIGHISFV